MAVKLSDLREMYLFLSKGKNSKIDRQIAFNSRKLIFLLESSTDQEPLVIFPEDKEAPQPESEASVKRTKSKGPVLKMRCSIEERSQEDHQDRSLRASKSKDHSSSQEVESLKPLIRQS